MSKNTEHDVEFIQALANLLNESDLSEIEVERSYGEDDELKVRLSRGGTVVAAPPVAAAPVTVSTAAPAPAAQTSAPAPAAASDADQPDLSNAVTSPMVGTVYLSPEPGAEPFVSSGEEVREGQTILIIEAMKTMNQIPAPRSGRVRAILVDNAEPVEFGEPLIIIE